MYSQNLKNRSEGVGIKRILFLIVLAQFCCTSLWFAGNAILNDISLEYNLDPSNLGNLISSVQFGFICGTLLFALLSISDRYSPSKVFFTCAIFGAVLNCLTILEGNILLSLLALRFGVGFFLAGIYPVGMKIASDYFKEGLGLSLGYLVGALVLGTAFPHLLVALDLSFSWRIVMIVTSLIASFGGLLILIFVPDGPHRKAKLGINIGGLSQVFESKKFRASAFGYFGHMWELYAYWTFVPIILIAHSKMHFYDQENLSLLSFLIIGIGSLSCVIGGYISKVKGEKFVAFYSLLISFFCCLISPLMFFVSNECIFAVFLLIWGAVVISDSPQFSTLVANNADPKLKGTALTIVNCIGFAITIVSIQMLNYLSENFPPDKVFLILAIGPLFGLLSMRKL